MDKWHIDKQYFNNAIKKGNRLLKDKRTRREERKVIQDEIQVLKNFLDDKFDYYGECNIEYGEITNIVKDRVLRKLKREAKIFNESLIKYFNLLYMSNILTEKNGNNKTCLDMDTQSIITLRNYQKNSQYLLNILNKIKTKNNILVEENSKLEYSSYCYYSYINNSQILVVNPKENCYNFNHELEHALENILGYNRGNYFQELGSINFEMLFLDLLYNINGSICDGDYEERVFDMYWYLDELIKYFNLLKEFKKNNFNVTLKEFKKIIMDTMDISEDEVEDFVMEEILGDGIDSTITYLFSYLQAIKIRKNHILNNIDNFGFIKSYLTTNTYKFNDSKDFIIYDEYFNTMAKRVRNK